MPTQIITLGENGIRVEAEVTEARRSRVGEIVPATIDSIRPALQRVIQPVADTWKDLSQFSQSLNIEQAEIEVGFGFETSGNIFVASSKGNINLKIKLVVKHVPAPKET
jgi:hypothetical protein